MLINWFTVSAQIINFLILVVLLKYLLYDRIIKGMEKREDEIESRFDEAEKREEEARQQKEENKRERDEFEKKKDQLFDEAEKEADKKKKELLKKAEEEAEAQRKEWHDSLENDRDSFLEEFRRLASGQVFSITRKVIGGLADSDLDEMIAEKFINRLKDLDSGKKEELSSAAEKEKSAVVKSRSGLSKSMRGKITRIIHDEINSDIEVSYEVDHDMMPGIELSCGGQEIIWSSEKHLDEMEEKTKRALEKQRKKLRSKSSGDNKKSDEDKDGNDEGEN